MSEVAPIYPPLAQWVEQLRVEIEVQRATLLLMENRLALCEMMLEEVMKQKEGQNEH